MLKIINTVRMHDIIENIETNENRRGLSTLLVSLAGSTS